MVRIGIIDTGVNPWHSHVRGKVDGLRIYVDGDGSISEDEDFRDPVGHGTAVAGVLREAMPDAELYAVRVFNESLVTYPSLVARGILRAAAAGCDVINMSLAIAAGEADQLLADACEAAHDAGCVLVAADRREARGESFTVLPAALPMVFKVEADDTLSPGEVIIATDGSLRCRAPGVPRDLGSLMPGKNLWGSSFACARVTAYLAANFIANQTVKTAIEKTAGMK